MWRRDVAASSFPALLGSSQIHPHTHTHTHARPTCQAQPPVVPMHFKCEKASTTRTPLNAYGSNKMNRVGERCALIKDACHLTLANGPQTRVYPYSV